MTWTPDTLFEICCYGSPDCPWIWRPVRGWVRHPWGITREGAGIQVLHHIPTGSMVPAGRMASLHAAQALADRLDRLEIDWSADTTEKILGQLERRDLMLEYHEIVPQMAAI